MNLTIVLVSNKSELKRFVKFPFSLYKDEKNWIPPLISDELFVLDKNKNPSADHCEIACWLAYDGSKVVGRIAGIIVENEALEKKKARFGWFDFVDDKEVSKALLTKVEKWAKEQGLTSVHGPLGFTDMDFEGVLVDGFSEPSTIATLYNYSYYKEHLEFHGYAKSVDWLEIEADIPTRPVDKLVRMSRLVKDKHELKIVEFKSTKDMKAYGHKMFDALNASYTELYGFHELTKKEIDYYLKQYFSFLIPGFVGVVVDKNDDIVAFGITMPSLSNGFKKANGSLFPFGFIHILNSLKTNKIVDLYLVGVRPEYKKYGVTAMIFDYIHKTFLKRGMTKVFTNPILEKNNDMINLMKVFQDEIKIRKRRRCYNKQLS